MHREREAFHVGALMNMAALVAGQRVVILVIRNCSVLVGNRVTVMKYNRASFWRRMASDVGD